MADGWAGALGGGAGCCGGMAGCGGMLGCCGAGDCGSDIWSSLSTMRS